MRTQLTGAALAALLIAAPAAAQGRSGLAVRVPVAVASITFDSARVERARTLLSRAESRWYAYDLKGARRDYARAAEILQEQQIYAGPALVSQAHVTYASEGPVEAAQVLVAAAAEAARYGDLELQVAALFDASLLYAEARDVGQAKALLADARRLLASSYLPASVKEAIERRIAMGE
jgi:hypothetical protein